MFLSLNNHVLMLSIACPLRYPLKTIQFILHSSLMPFASLLSYVMQLLHSLVLTHHLLHPFLTLLLCFRRFPSEPQLRACNPKLLQATVLPSRHGLARYGLSPALTTARICFTDRIFFPSTRHPPACGLYLLSGLCSFIAPFTMSRREAIFLGKSFCSTGVASFTPHASFSSFAVTLLHRWLEKETSLRHCPALTISSA